MALARARAIDHHAAPKTARNTRPVRDEMKWPPITLRGCENGLSGKLNKSTQLAPNEPNTSGVPLEAARYATVPMASSAPREPRTISFAGNRAGAGPAPRILLRRVFMATRRMRPAARRPGPSPGTHPSAALVLRGLFRALGCIAGAVGVCARSRKLAAIDDQVLVAYGLLLEPTFENLTRACRVAGLR